LKLISYICGEIGRGHDRLNGEVPTPSHLLFWYIILNFGTMEEIWKDIPGYEGIYQCSNMGRMRRISQEQWRKTPRSPKYRYIKGSTSSRTKVGWYALVSLTSGKRELLHRLIAKTFIPNPGNKPQINHIDGNPQNNRIDNLEWVTQSENMLHAFYVLGYVQSEETKQKRARKLYKKVIDHTDNRVYESAKEYAKIKKLRYNSVIRKLNNYLKNNLNIEYYNETAR